MVLQRLLNTVRYIESVGFSFSFDYSCLLWCLATVIQRNGVPIFTTMLGTLALESIISGTAAYWGRTAGRYPFVFSSSRGDLSSYGEMH